MDNNQAPFLCKKCLLRQKKGIPGAHHLINGIKIHYKRVHFGEAKNEEILPLGDILNVYNLGELTRDLVLELFNIDESEN